MKAITFQRVIDSAAVLVVAIFIAALVWGFSWVHKNDMAVNAELAQCRSKGEQK